MFLMAADAMPVAMTGQAPAAVVQPAALASGDGGEGPDRAMQRLIGGVIGYTRWPAARPGAMLRVCIAGRARLAADPVPPFAASGAPLIWQFHPPARWPAPPPRGAAPPELPDCDVIYLGQMPRADHRRIGQLVRTRPVLTIAEDDPSCLFGSIICLTNRPGSSEFGFTVNLDSLARSGLKIDPRVLRIGQAGGGGQ